MEQNQYLKRFAVFDSHFHIIDPHFPLVANAGFLPEEFNCTDYRTAMSPYRLIGRAVGSGSFQAFDQTYLIAAALKHLGPSFVGALVNIETKLLKLPALSIDYLGLSQAGLPCLIRLAARGVQVRQDLACVDFAIRPALTALYDANPQALMFGTDLPSTRAPRPYSTEDYFW